MLNTEKIRKDFPILRRKIRGRPLVYLDNAATTQKPRQVIAAISDFYSLHNANVHRSAHTLASEATKIHDDARRDVAKFLHAKDDRGIVFVRNATEAINLAAYSWALSNIGEGDEILLSRMEHHSNLVPWQWMQKFGAKLVFAEQKRDGTLDMKDFESKVGSKTKLVAITQKSNVLGTTVDVSKISRIAHDAGAIVLVDGAQSVPSMPVDVSKIECDLLAFSGHKLLGPMGIGVLYGRPGLLDIMPPFLYGGDMIQGVSYEKASWNTLPYKFEAGTPDVANAAGLGAAVGYLEKVGMANVERHLVDLTKYALKRLDGMHFIKVFGSSDAKKRPGVISFEVEGVHPHDVSEILDSRGIAIRAGYHCAQPLVEMIAGKPLCRASFYIYNSTKDADALVAGLKEVHRIFTKRN